jgi:hypothetical protein
MACLKNDKGTPETRLYVVFNHEDDESARHCRQHLQTIFEMLRRVPNKPPAVDGSPKVIANELEDYFIEICKAIHNYSFEIFAHRVSKREHKLSDIREFIEQDRTHFTTEQRSILVNFLEHVHRIIMAVAKAQTTGQLSTTFIKMLLWKYSHWTEHDLLPKDSPADKKVTLLDRADLWLAEEHNIGFQLRRWALKIMSFLITANRLFILTQSHRLRKLLQGNFSVRVLTSPTTAPYYCDLSSKTIQVALDAAVAEISNLPADWDQKRESFIEWLSKKLEVSEVRQKPKVHAELAMIIAMAKGEIKDVLPYVGVSKLSCIMCSHYIRAFNEVTKQKIATKGSHGKAYPGWSWPSLPDSDEELRPAFLRRIRQQLLSDVEQHAENLRRLSDSSMGSGGPEWQIGRTIDEIKELDDMLDMEE